METQERSRDEYEINRDTVVWKDRRRILGMPITFTRYEVTPERLTIRQGLFTTRTDELLLYRILDFNLKRTFGQKIFGVGTLTVFSGDRSHSEINLVNIKNSDEVRRLLGRMVEAERERKRVAAREMYGQSFDDNLYDMDGDGRPDFLE